MKTLTISRCVFVLLSLLFYASSFTQKTSTLIDRDKILIGEQVNVKIKIDDIPQGVNIIQDIRLPDTINHLEILSHTIDTVSVSGRANYIHNLVITSFDSGYWQLPAFELVFDNGKRLTSEALNITVLSVDVSNLQDFHDIKDILEVPLENNWYIISALVGVFIFSLFAVLWFVQKRKNDTVQNIRPGTLSDMYKDLIQLIDDYQRSGIYDPVSVKKVYHKSSHATRSFLDALWSANTNHFTTSEYMINVKSNISSTDEQTRYFQFLRLADAVKFARYLPSAEESKEVLERLQNFITLQYEHRTGK